MSIKNEEKNKNKEVPSYIISSVDRAIHLLLTLAEHPNSGVTELAEAYVKIWSNAPILWGMVRFCSGICPAVSPS
jgi:hypothetical protein